MHGGSCCSARPFEGWSTDFSCTLLSPSQISSRRCEAFNNVIIALDEEILDSFRLYSQKAIRDWTKIDHLKHVSTFGIREYRNKSKLPLHTDRKDTHILSAIINIYQDHEWNLEIYDHNLQAHQVSLKPGEYILYESATCLHGRPTPFIGKKYANVFVHFQVDMISDPLDIFWNLSPKKGSLLYHSEQTLYSDYLKHGFSNALIAFEKVNPPQTNIFCKIRPHIALQPKPLCGH